VTDEADAIVIIDADLQDPPELIPDLLTRWRDGYDVVYATREHREGESWFKRATAHLFYRLMARMAAFNVPHDTGDFRLMSARAVAALRQLRERQRFMKGLFGWIGYPHTAVMYQRSPRQAGRTKWNYWRLFNLAVEGITSFSILPLRLATAVGVATSVCAFSYGAGAFIKAVLWGDPVKGYPSLMVVVLVLGGLQLLALGVVGEYLGRVYAEVKQRPIYLIETACQVPMMPPLHSTARADAPPSVAVASLPTKDPR
ncbi:glycosyl transferase family 2, partial [Rhodanobacter sp. FW510-R12]